MGRLFAAAAAASLFYKTRETSKIKCDSMRRAWGLQHLQMQQGGAHEYSPVGNCVSWSAGWPTPTSTQQVLEMAQQVEGA